MCASVAFSIDYNILYAILKVNNVKNSNRMHEIYDKCAPRVKFVKLDACGEDMIPLTFTVKPDG